MRLKWLSIPGDSRRILLEIFGIYQECEEGCESFVEYFLYSRYGINLENNAENFMSSNGF